MKKTHKNYILLVFSIIVIGFIIGIVELLISKAKGTIVIQFPEATLFTLFNAVYTYVLLGLLWFPFYYLLEKAVNKLGIFITKIVFVLLIIIQVILSKYYTYILTPLGVDLFGYSWKDIEATVYSSTTISYKLILALIFSPVVFFVIYHLFSRLLRFKLVVKGLLVFFILGVVIKIRLFDYKDEHYTNKTVYLVTDSAKLFMERFKRPYKGIEYPLLKSVEKTPNVLGSFFKESTEKPNIVIILVEGLGRDFMGEGAQFQGFTPYLDALSKQSLYWENFLCNSGRSFGVLPTIMGSLPFGTNGFLEENTNLSYLSLISILNNNGYTTSYYEGGDVTFDKKNVFLENESIDNILDETGFDFTYEKIPSKTNGFSWGYADKELYRKTLSMIDFRKSPRLDILFTNAIHNPYNFIGHQEYQQVVNNMLFDLPLSDNVKETVAENLDAFASFLYADEAINTFISQYKQREDFQNTIFIITGDHRLVPIYRRNELCRFHVPLIIYSPLVKQPQKFSSLSSHLDIAPSLVALLRNNFKIKTPIKTAWLGKGIDTSVIFQNTRSIPLMKNKGKISDFIDKDIFYAYGKYFKIDSVLGVSPISEFKQKDSFQDKLRSYKKLDKYLVEKNKILPIEFNYPKSKNYASYKSAHKFTLVQRKLIKRLTEGLDYDAVYIKAQQLAKEDKHDTALLLCDYILNWYPNYFDALILKGRLLAWNQEYDKAEVALLKVLERKPSYLDAYLAIIDVYFWSEKNEKIITIAEKSVKNNLSHFEIQFKLAKAYERLGNFQYANEVIDQLIEKYPNKEKFQQYKKILSKRDTVSL